MHRLGAGPGDVGCLVGQVGGVLGPVAPGLVGRDQLGGEVGSGEDQQRLDPPLVQVVGVAEVGQDVGDLLQGRVEDRNGGERGADVEPAQPVVVLLGAGRPCLLLLGRLPLPCGGGRRVGGGHHPLEQSLEPGPGQPAVGIGRDPGVDIGRLLRGQVTGLPGDQPGQVDPHPTGHDAMPELPEAVTQVEPVGHQHPRRDRRHPQPCAELGGRELGDLRRTRPAEAPRPLPARPAGLGRVEPVAVVEVGMLHRGPQDPDLAPPLCVREVGGMVEQLTARQPVNLHHHIHMPTLA